MSEDIEKAGKLHVRGENPEKLSDSENLVLDIENLKSSVDNIVIKTNHEIKEINESLFDINKKFGDLVENGAYYSEQAEIIFDEYKNKIFVAFIEATDSLKIALKNEKNEINRVMEQTGNDSDEYLILKNIKENINNTLNHIANERSGILKKLKEEQEEWEYNNDYLKGLEDAKSLGEESVEGGRRNEGPGDSPDSLEEVDRKEKEAVIDNFENIQSEQELYDKLASREKWIDKNGKSHDSNSLVEVIKKIISGKRKRVPSVFGLSGATKRIIKNREIPNESDEIKEKIVENPNYTQGMEALEGEVISEGDGEIIEEIKMSSIEQTKNIFEGIANLGYRSNELKSNVLKKVYRKFASLSKEGNALNNYFNNFSDIYGKLESNSRKKREEVGKSKFSRGVGIGQGIGNILKYGRILVGNGFSNPARYITAISMFASRASEAGKEARFDSLQQANEREHLSEDEANLLGAEAYEEAMDVYNGLKEKTGKDKLSAQDLEDYYIAEVPDSLKSRLDKLSKEEGAGVKWLARQLNKQASKIVNKIQEKIDAINNSDLDEDKKDLEIKKILRKNSKKLKEFDRMLSDQGVVDSMAYMARMAEKSGKTIANLLMLDTGYRLFSSGFDFLKNGFFDNESEIELRDLDITKNQTSKAMWTPEDDGMRGAIPGGSNSENLFKDNIETAENIAKADSDELNIESENVATMRGSGENKIEIPDNDTTNTSEIDSEAESIDKAPLAYMDNIKIPEQHEVLKGESVWKISKNLVSGNKEFSSLSEGQQTHVIDRIKDALVGQADKNGFLKEGQVLELDKIKPEDINKAILEAKGFSPEKIAQIESHNAILREFIKNNPEAPRTSQNYEAILKGEGLTGREQVLDNEGVEKIIGDHMNSSEVVQEKINARIDKIYNKGSFLRDQTGEWQHNKTLGAQDVLDGKFNYPERLKEPRVFEYDGSEGGLGNDPEYQKTIPDNRDTYLGSQLDQVELNNREQLTDYLKEAQETIGKPEKGESVEHFLDRYESVNHNETSSGHTVSEDNNVKTTVDNKQVPSSQEVVNEVKYDHDFIEKFNNSYRGLDKDSKLAMMNNRFLLSSGKDIHDFDKIDKSLGGHLKEFFNKNPELDPADVYIKDHEGKEMIIDFGDDNRYISINDNGEISALNIENKGTHLWKPEGDKKIDDKNIKNALNYLSKNSNSADNVTDGLKEELVSDGGVDGIMNDPWGLDLKIDKDVVEELNNRNISFEKSGISVNGKLYKFIDSDFVFDNVEISINSDKNISFIFEYDNEPVKFLSLGADNKIKENIIE